MSNEFPAQPPPNPTRPAVPPAPGPPPAYPTGQAYSPQQMAYAYPPLPQKPPALPAEAVEYPHVLRGARRAWWRPIASFGLVLVGVIGVFIGFAVMLGVAAFVMGGGDVASMDQVVEDFNNPVIFAGQNLMLATLIPIAMLATWIAHGVRPGFVSSVLGRFRWGWFGWSLLVTVPLWLAYIGLSLLLGSAGSPEAQTSRPSTWVALIVLTLLTTPLQAAGEEYLFRGWLMQQLGAWFKNTYVALGAAIVVSSVVFALAHTSLDPWVLLDLGAFATAAVLLTWRTGGLEAAVALHIVNNVIVLILFIMTTGLNDAFITPDTTGDGPSTLVSVVALAITTTVLWWLAGKRGVARRTTGA